MKNDDKKVIIVQSSLPEYRLPLFELLSKSDGIDLEIAYSSSIDKNSVEFNNIFLKAISFYKFKYQLGVNRLGKNADVLVLMFDIHWLSSLLMTVLYRNKVLLWGHGYGKSKLGNIIRTLLVKASCALIVYEDNEIASFVDNGINEEKLFYSGNTVLIQNYGREDVKKTQFLYVGRLQERKKIDNLLLAFCKIKNDLSEDVGITILGDGDIRDNLVKLADKLGIGDRVTFLPAVYDEVSLKKVFSNALAYVSPGHVGLGVLHSFAYGVPVITQTSYEHAPEVNNIKHGINGLIVENSLDVLSNALLRIDHDKVFQNMLSEAAYEHYINNRTMTHMVDRFNRAIDYVYMKNNQVS